MAYVSISASTVQEIRAKIHRMSIAEIESLGSTKIELDEIDCDAIERHVWDSDYALLATLPTKWLRGATSVQLDFKASTDASDPDNVKYGFSHTFEAKAPREIRMPPRSTTGVNGRFSFNDQYNGRTGTVQLDARLLRAEKIQPIYDHFALRASVAHRWQGVGQQVIKFVEGSKSLNEAIKLWPQLEMYVPKPLMDKVMEKKAVTKSVSRAAELLKELDTEAAIASATLARLAQSSAA